MCIQPQSSFSNAGIILATCSGSALQNWGLQLVFNAHSNQYAIINQQTGFCINVPGESTSLGVQNIQYACQNPPTTNAAWVFTYSAVYGYYVITNANSGLALDVNGQSTQSGGIVDQWTNTAGATNEQWLLCSQCNTTCVAGQYRSGCGATSGGTCEWCAAGTYSTAPAEACATCSAGTYASASGEPHSPLVTLIRTPVALISPVTLSLT